MTHPNRISSDMGRIVAHAPHGVLNKTATRHPRSMADGPLKRVPCAADAWVVRPVTATRGGDLLRTSPPQYITPDLLMAEARSRGLPPLRGPASSVRYSSVHHSCSISPSP